jgi:hypothetical protein
VLLDVSDTVTAQLASNVQVVPAGNIASSNVQSALQELDSEKLALTGGTITGNLEIGTAGSLTFEGSTANAFETTLAVVDPTADRTITLPNATGTVVTTGDTGTVTSTMLLNDTIVDADINSSAEIAVSKLADGAARQLLQTDAAGTGVEWTNDVDVPGTLDVTSTATFDATAVFAAGSAGSPSLTIAGDTDTGIYSPGANQVAVATNGTERLRVTNTGLVGVGTSVPGYKLDVNGDISSSGRGTSFGYKLPDCRVFNPSSGGIFAIDDYTTTRFFITSAGLVGIGTSAPDVLLHSRITGGGGVPATSGTSQPNAAIRIGGSSTSGILDIGCNSDAPWIQSTDRTDLSQKYKLLLNPNGGNVGIGVTAPGKTLEVSTVSSSDGIALSRAGSNRVLLTADGLIAWGATANQGTLTWDTNQAVIRAAASNSLVFAANNSSEYARIDTSGRLLVGTSTSTNNYRVQSESTDFGQLSIRRNVAGAGGPGFAISHSRGSAGGSYTALVNGDEFGGIYFYGADGTQDVNGAVISAVVDGTPGANDMPGRLVFSTTADGAASPTERMRITSAGDVRVGTTAAPFSSTGIQLSQTGNIQASASDDYPLLINRQTSDGTIVEIRRGWGTVGTISVTTTATAYNTSSDYRLKENVVSLTGAIDRVNDLQVRRFNFTADPDKTVDGFIAHEAQAVVPECVTGTKDAVDDEGKPVYQGIDQSKLVPLLTAALQEAIGEIESLKARVVALESV